MPVLTNNVTLAELQNAFGYKGLGDNHAAQLDVLSRLFSVFAGVTVGTTTGLTMEQGISNGQQTLTFTLDEVSIATVDATTAGAQGSMKLCDLPAALYDFGASSFALDTAAGAGGLSDTAALVWSVGTTAAAVDNATLTTTEANVVPSTAGTLSSGVNAAVRGATAAPAPVNLMASGGALYLNCAVADAGTSADDIVTVSGQVTVAFAAPAYSY